MMEIAELRLLKDNRQDAADILIFKFEDLAMRKNKILETEWDDICCFICLNPMAATFGWSDLVEKAFKDEDEGLEYTTSIHIWKAMVHTRWHVRLGTSTSKYLNAK